MKKRYPKDAPRLVFMYDNTCEDVTIRRGLKWFEQFHYNAAREVVLLDGAGKPFGMATLLEAHAMPLFSLGEEAVRETRAFYPDISADEYVTVLYIRRGLDG